MEKRLIISVILASELILTGLLFLFFQSILQPPSLNPNPFIEIRSIERNTFLEQVKGDPVSGTIIGYGQRFSDQERSFFAGDLNLTTFGNFSVDGVPRQVIGISEPYAFIVYAKGNSNFNLSLARFNYVSMIMDWEVDLNELLKDTISVNDYNGISYSFQMKGLTIYFAYAFRTSIEDKLLIVEISFSGTVGRNLVASYERGSFSQNSGIVEDNGKLLFLSGLADERLNARSYIEIGDDLMVSDLLNIQFASNVTSPISSVLTFIPLSFVTNSSLFLLLEQGKIIYRVILEGNLIEGEYGLRSTGIPSIQNLGGLGGNQAVVHSQFFEISQGIYFIPLVDADTEFPSQYNFGNKSMQLLGILADTRTSSIDFVEIKLSTGSEGTEYYVPLNAIKYEGAIYLLSGIYQYSAQPLSVSIPSGFAAIKLSFTAFSAETQKRGVFWFSLLSFFIPSTMILISVKIIYKKKPKFLQESLYPNDAER